MRQVRNRGAMGVRRSLFPDAPFRINVIHVDKAILFYANSGLPE